MISISTYAFFAISPAPDRRVRRPDGALLEPGETVKWSAYWTRRLNAGDVVLDDTGADKRSKKKGE